jgi:RNA recognition motif-containing protein
VRGYHKGFGFVIFEELEDADRVLTIKDHYIQDVRVLVTKNLLKSEYKLKKEQESANKLENMSNQFDQMDLGKTSAPVQNDSYSEAPKYYQYAAPLQGHTPKFDLSIQNPQSYPREDARYHSHQNLAHGNQAHSDFAYQNARYPIAPSIAIGMDNHHANYNYRPDCLSPNKATSVSRARLGTNHDMQSVSNGGSGVMYSGFDGKPYQFSQQTILSYPSNSGPANNQNF